MEFVKVKLTKMQEFLVARRQVAFAKLSILFPNIQRNWTLLPTRRSR